LSLPSSAGRDIDLLVIGDCNPDVLVLGGCLTALGAIASLTAADIPGRQGLVAAGPRLVVKLGSRGALCADAGASWQVSLPPVTAVDTTGAGDCFNAGLIAGLLSGRALAEAAALGCAAGALSTGAAGGTAAAPGLAAATELSGQATIRLRVGA
jgi:sugar/nucleoside kinase (ribokinase family)